MGTRSALKNNHSEEGTTGKNGEEEDEDEHQPQPPPFQQQFTDDTDAIEQELEAVGIVQPPDGGWGWMVVLGSFLANVVVDGVIFTSGAAFQPEWEAEYGASNSATAWTVSLLSGMYLIAGPIASALVNIYSCRTVTVVGCLLAASGFILSKYAPNLWVLYVTFGLMGGIGFGLMYLPAIMIVSFYFKERRALATGLAVCGSGIGTFAFAPLSKYLMDEFSWNQTMLIVAGITLNGLVSAALFRDLKPTKKQIEDVARVAEKYALGGDGVGAGDYLSGSNGRILSEVEVSEMEDGNSPHVAAGVQIERFPSRRSRTTSEHPFMSVMELRARERQTSIFSMNSNTNMDFKSKQELTRVISRDSVAQLNQPMSRADIFYSGSVANLSGPKHQRTTTVTDYGVKTAANRMRSMRSLTAASVLSIPQENPVLDPSDWKENLRSTLNRMLDITLLTSPTFCLLAFCGFLTLAGFFVPFIYLPRHAMAIGHSKDDATFLISILGIANIVFRILCGWLSDQSWLDPLLLHNVAVMIGGLATMAVPYFQPYWLLVLYCVVFGFGTACFASLRSIICVELLGLERLSNAFGFLLLFMGVAALVGSPIAGALYDATDSYDLSFQVMGAAVALSGLLAFPLRRLAKWEEDRFVAQYYDGNGYGNEEEEEEEYEMDQIDRETAAANNNGQTE